MGVNNKEQPKVSLTQKSIETFEKEGRITRTNNGKLLFSGMEVVVVQNVWLDKHNDVFFK